MLPMSPSHTFLVTFLDSCLGNQTNPEFTGVCSHLMYASLLHKGTWSKPWLSGSCGGAGTCWHRDAINTGWCIVIFFQLNLVWPLGYLLLHGTWQAWCDWRSLWLEVYFRKPQWVCVTTLSSDTAISHKGRVNVTAPPEMAASSPLLTAHRFCAYVLFVIISLLTRDLVSATIWCNESLQFVPPLNPCGGKTQSSL